ncbi:MAG: hypothetical protein ACR2IV_05825 [Bryobacteraceae bacterium]
MLEHALIDSNGSDLQIAGRCFAQKLPEHISGTSTEAIGPLHFAQWLADGKAPVSAAIPGGVPINARKLKVQTPSV